MVPSGEFAGVRVSRRDRWRGGDASSRLDDGSTVGGGDSTKKGKGRCPAGSGRAPSSQGPAMNPHSIQRCEPGGSHEITCVSLERARVKVILTTTVWGFFSRRREKALFVTRQQQIHVIPCMLVSTLPGTFREL